MDKLFNTIRRIHLYASFVTATFLLMYFLTGAFMIMGKLFPRGFTETLSEQVTVNAGMPEADIIASICNQYNIHGEVTIKNLQDNKKIYNYFRPGYRAEILVNEAVGTARVKVSQGKFPAVMNDFHRLSGYTGSWIHQLWSLWYDITCISLIVMALTGVYLWWKLERKKKTGIIFIFVSTGITVFTIMYIVAVC